MDYLISLYNIITWLIDGTKNGAKSLYSYNFVVLVRELCYSYTYVCAIYCIQTSKQKGRFLLLR
jgi:hypothetical protein